LEVIARTQSRKGREAEAEAVLSDANSGEVLYELDVSYKVLSQAVFQRLFAAHRKDVRVQPRLPANDGAEPWLALPDSPYAKPLPLAITQRQPGKVEA